MLPELLEASPTIKRYRWTVAWGSRITFSPFLVYVMVGTLTGLWSQSKGASDGLMNPAAKARRTKKMTKRGKAALVGMTAGMAGMTKRK
jgi:hypothetical protein